MKMLTFEDITHPDDRANDNEALKDVYEGRKSKHIAEIRYLKKNGEIIWGIQALTKISVAGDKPDYALALIKDITDRRKVEEELSRLNADLESRVKIRTSELEAVNKELETFTYSVSHDLKAPLRGIDGYSKLLSDIYKADLNEEAQRFIDTIRNSTLHMNHLIDDLLDYSRLERSHLSIGRIKIKDLIQSLLSIYTVEMEARSIQVKMEVSDDEVIADLKGLTIAIRNLIENAIKFTKGCVNPFIQIKLEEHNLSWIISIRDNGIGFDMQYHKKIFEIFQRLQRIEDFPGTGIGLAMVSKIMQRMNGKVWAESTPGMGSTFYLEVIKNP
jgi:signal transduction histidine kinase